MGSVSPISRSASEPTQNECPNCGFLAWCLPASLELRESQRLHGLVTHQRPIKRDGFLYHAGSALGSLYVISSGFMKSSITDGDGREQVAGFSMTGDLVGMDAIGTGRHMCDTVALEDGRLCGMRYADLEELGSTSAALQRHFFRVMGTEIARDHGVMLLLGAMRVEERIAVFLLDLSRRFSARGYSGTHFRLPMRRQEIASHLGLQLETVSRAFSHFNHIQLTAINGKDVEIRSLARLQEFLSPRFRPSAAAACGKLGIVGEI
jgi:CRP/FNR family transcriptional regulator, anaerobic regulatory protein